MKFKLYPYIAAFMLIAGLSSCEDFLDLAPISTATQSNAFKTASDAEAAITGCYDSFQGDMYVWDNIMYGDVRSDNHYAGGDNPNIFEIDELRVPATSSRILGSWRNLYSGISRCNLVLARVPSIDDAKLEVGNRKQQILGEASFLRAYHYFNLVKLFGGVPLMLSPVESTEPGATNVARASVEEVYAQIITDLEFAAANLPSTYSGDPNVNKARATKGAANALLAKVYVQKPSPDYTKALAAANAVINDTEAGYQLLANFDQLFDGAHYNNAESILEIQYVGGTEGNWGPQLLLPPSLSGDSWRKFITPSHNLVAAYDAAGDVVRKNATIFWENVSWTDEYWAVGGGNVPFSYKWRSAGGWSSTNRQYLLRLADIILIKAEAQNELGQAANAAATLNIVRSRVGLANTTANTQATLRTAILNERRLELAQEAQRWDDLVRYGKAVEVMQALVETNLVSGQKINFNMNANKTLLPIPQAERERNPSLTQNPGFE